MGRNCLSRIGLAIPALVMSGILFSGCGKSLSESEVAYAGPVLDSILEGIGDRDYGKFSKDFSEKMKDAVKEEDFYSLVATLDEKLGTYEEKSFSSAMHTQTAGIDLTIVAYEARYSEESSVMIKIYVTDNGESKLIEGLLIDAPSLQQ